MALVLNDRVRETTTIVGTGTATLLGAATGYQSFAVVGNGNTCYYCISDQGGPNWEVGVGTYTSAGTTLARTTVLNSSNGGALVSFTAGTKDVFVTYPSERAVYGDASNQVTLAGSLGIGNITTGASLSVNKGITGGATAYSVVSTAEIQSDVTANANIFLSLPITAAAAFTLIVLRHFYANQSTIGAGSAVTNQYGFHADLTLTGATNNYGFSGNIPAATGRYNLYMNGTASNYLAGSLGIGTLPTTSYKVLNSGNWTGATTFYGFASQGVVQSDVTSSVFSYRSAPSTAAAAFTLTVMTHYIAVAGNIGAGSTITTQQGFNAGANLTGATNNYGFYGNIPAATGRYNLYMNGTADNYLAGSLGIGGIDARAMVNVGGSIVTGTGIEYFRAGGTLPATATAYVIPFHCEVTTPASATTFAELASFKSQPVTTGANSVLSVLNHFAAAGPSLGSGASITNQYGFASQISLTTATNNYGFYGNIPAGTGRYNLYMSGTADNYLGGSLITAGLKAISAAAPTIASATTIAPTTQIAFVSGVTPIATITAPSPISLGGGQITLIPTGIFTTTTAGNIALASTAIVGKALIMTYDSTTTKWYPSY